MGKFSDRDIIKRIQLLRNQYSGNRGKSKFAQELGISASTYNYYEKNRVPPINVLLKICEITNVDLEWLITGHSEAKKPTMGLEKFAHEKKTEQLKGLNATLMRKIENLLNQNPELAEPVSAFIELLSEKKGIEDKFHSKEAISKRGRPGWIPILGRTAAGIVHFWDQTILPEPRQAVTELNELVTKHIGKDIIDYTGGKVLIDLRNKSLIDGVKIGDVNLIQVSGQESDSIVEFVECEEIFKLFPDSFALRIDGDSMSPRINDGDVVMLSPSVPAAQGQIAIVRIKDQIGVTCKLIRSTDDSIHLIPINERYEPKIVLKKDLLWTLAVLCHINL